MLKVNDTVRVIGDSEPQHNFIASAGIAVGDQGVVVDIVDWIHCGYPVTVRFNSNEGVKMVAFKECELEKI